NPDRHQEAHRVAPGVEQPSERADDEADKDEPDDVSDHVSAIPACERHKTTGLTRRTKSRLLPGRLLRAAPRLASRLLRLALDHLAGCLGLPLRTSRGPTDRASRLPGSLVRCALGALH